MVGDDKKVKTNPALKSDAAATKKPETPAADKSTPDAAPSTPESSEKPAASPASYRRGEGQKLSRRRIRTIGTRSLARKRRNVSVSAIAKNVAP